MKKTLFYIFSILFLTSCSEVEDWFDTEEAKNAVELSGVEATLYGSEKTRAAALDKQNYVGRSEFIHGDQMVLTTIKRTPNPSASPEITSIPGFSYSGIVYNHAVEEGQTAGGWNRDENTGKTEASNTHPDKIYWSDASNDHTYIGYSVPLQESGVTFDWNMKPSMEGVQSRATGIDTYYGSIGNPRVQQTTDVNGVITNYIDYSNNADDAGEQELDKNNNPTGVRFYKSGNAKIKRDDLLLTYDTEKQAEPGGSVAKLYYHHALANVRVVVNISGFSATSESADARSIVEDMVLKDMLTMYKWRQNSYAAEELKANFDTYNLNEIYGSGSGVTYNQKKDVHMWIPRKNGTGSGVGKQFVFYALAVPTTMEANQLRMEFKVRYQDPMNPWADANKTEPNMKDHLYTATMEQAIVFRAGWCTTINISLNHNNEIMTVGAEYMDWEFDPSPDEGELKKNSTLLQGTDRSRVTIFGDRGIGEENLNADADDATWLYVDPQTNELLDIYGNDGSPNKPFIISTEEQLLSFAYEVKGTNRTSVTIKRKIADSNGKKPGDTGYTPTYDNGRTISEGGGFDFSGYYVKLDADITLQKTITDESNLIQWIGVGDETHAFNGVFLGSGRHINRLYGQPFFNKIGTDAVVDKIDFANVISVNGTGVVANKNYGVLCACNVEGNVAQSKPTDVANSYCGSFVGENDGFIIACAHVGKVSGYGTVGGLVGFNNGTVMACYHSGVVEAKNENDVKVPANAHPTVGKYGAGTNGENNSIMFSCYYDKDVFTDSRTLVEGKLGYPLPTTVMQNSVFVGGSATDNSFVFDAQGNVDTHGPILRTIAEKIVKESPGNTKTDAEIAAMTDQELIAAILPANALSGEVLSVFNYHFTLNTAIRVFNYWINRIYAQNLTSVDTNCHTFTKAQIDFLHEHYTAEHVYKYAPAAYPKVQ